MLNNSASRGEVSADDVDGAVAMLFILLLPRAPAHGAMVPDIDDQPRTLPAHLACRTARRSDTRRR
ncbi:MAG TPA: hypothetical protein PLC79_04090 [Phycisphaerae bacterium]|nr:hypothetical protein [Phycisphaerae bacterium]